MKNIAYFITDLPGETAQSLGVASFVGSLHYGMRIDTPQGYLRCDGNEYPATAYGGFVNNQLKAGNIRYLTLAQYEEQLSLNHDNCGFFGYDEVQNILRAPKLQDSTFIAQALTAGDIGKYNQDQIVDITAKIGANISTPNERVRGAYEVLNEPNQPYGNVGGSGTGALQGVIGNASTLNFRASIIVNTGDKVQPRHIQYPLFVCVSNQSQPVDEENINLFLQAVNNKANVDASNINTQGINNIFEGATPDAVNNMVLKTFPDLDRGVAKAWGVVHQTTRAVWVNMHAYTSRS
jgi:hypothetical protein